MPCTLRALCLCVLLLCGCAFGTWSQSPQPGGVPGTVLQSQQIPGAPDNAAAYRILYRSTDPDGRPIEASGLTIIPRTTPPPGGRPVVAWAHPTTGVVPRCAPSEAIFRFQQIQGLRTMVANGYIVTESDYPGLGTPGPHPYLVGVSEARAVIDSVRAARTLPDANAGNRFIVWGHSQGGQAALFTGLIAADYAPDLTLLGVAAAAPATDLATLLQADLDTPAGKNLTAMTLWSWSRIYGAPMDKIVSPLAIPAIDSLARECIESVSDLRQRARTERPLETHFLTVPNLATTEPWASLIARNTPGPLPPSIPVFIAQGTADRIVRPSVTDAYVRRLCAGGSAVDYVRLPGTGHALAATDSALDAIAWMQARFDNRPPPNDCRS